MLYIIGGQDGSKFLGDLHQLNVEDLQQMSWTQIPIEGGIEPRGGMSFWAFDQKLYVFGGRGNNAMGWKPVEDGVQQIRLDLSEKTAKARPVKIEGLEPRYSHSTTVVQESPGSQTILILGGCNKNNKIDNAALAFRMQASGWYLLHYLDATNIRYLLGSNQCWDLFELRFEVPSD